MAGRPAVTDDAAGVARAVHVPAVVGRDGPAAAGEHPRPGQPVRRRAVEPRQDDRKATVGASLAALRAG